MLLLHMPTSTATGLPASVTLPRQQGQFVVQRSGASICIALDSSRQFEPLPCSFLLNFPLLRASCSSLLYLQPCAGALEMLFALQEVAGGEWNVPDLHLP